MTKSNKIFIYNGAEPCSANDLKELFTTKNILNDPDVKLTDFNFNVTGLSCPTFVIPGGSTQIIGNNLISAMKNIKDNLYEDFNYVGICAGSYLGVNADLFKTTHIYDYKLNGIEPPKYLYSTVDKSISFGLLPDYSALGAFYPDNRYNHEQTPKCHMPYLVTMTLHKNNVQLHQLYAAGPMFTHNNYYLSGNKSEVVATYDNLNNYTFFYKNNYKKTINSTPAAMLRRVRKNDVGGIFLSATHIETCVPNSSLLNFFKTSNGQLNEALNDSDIKILEDEQNKTKEIMEELLKETLSLQA